MGEVWRDLYPESFRSYEFLGDVAAARGNAQKARALYEQALARSPGHARIREKLGELSGGGASR